MNNIEIIINKENRMVDLKKSSIGNDGENLQYNLVFSFLNGFVDGQARLEYQISGEKYFAILEKHEETYTMPINSLLTKVGKILMQIVITQGTSEEEVPIFKSNVFYMFCNSSINAQTQEPDGYEEWLDIANTKLNELDNINIEATKENGVATITITNKDGSKEIVNLYDGEGAITNYEVLDNKPSINGVELVGDKTLEELNIQEKGDYLTSENDPLFKQSASYGITSQDIKNWNNKSEFSGNYDDLNGKPTIPTKTSELTNDSGYIKEIPSEYVTESELNEKGYLKSVPSEYVTEEELNNKKYLTSIPSEYVTETELNNKGYLTEHQSLDHLQEKLVSGSNIKTINGKSILGDGNIVVEGGGDYTLPIASKNTLGGIKVGANLTIEEDGTLNATASSSGGGSGADDVPINTIVEYDGEEVPDGWEEIEEKQKSLITIVGGGEKTYNIGSWVWTPIEFTKEQINLGDGFSYSVENKQINILKDMIIRVDAQISYFATVNGEMNIAIARNDLAVNDRIGYANRYDTFSNGSSTVNITGRTASVKAGDKIQIIFSGIAGTYKINQNDFLSCLTLQEL
jgi:hypothetical protein